MSALDSIFTWYRVISDSQKIIPTLLNHEQSTSNLKKLTIFHGKQEDEVKQLLILAHNEIDDLVIISLFALFERIVLDHISETILASQSLGASEQLYEQLKEKTSYEANRWRFQEILDMFKVTVDPDLVGQIKQIYQYRNWIAHGKKREKPMTIDPHQAYERLTEFLKEAKLSQ